jgi:putative ABC transport system permease protein
MLQDLRFGIRMLLKQPSFSLIAILTLALGIGATAAVFSLIQGVLLTPPPYRQPEKLVLIPPVRSDGQPMKNAPGWPAQQWLDWQKEAKSLESIAAYNWCFTFLVLPEGSESMEGMWVTKEYFSVFGLEAAFGRTFTESDTRPHAPPVIILGYEFWQRKFNGDRNIIGLEFVFCHRPAPPKNRITM